MTEQEWITATDPAPMLELVRQKASERKLRLMSLAACLDFLPDAPDGRLAEAYDTAERFADGLATEAERKKATATAVYLAVLRQEELRSQRLDSTSLRDRTLFFCLLLSTAAGTQAADIQAHILQSSSRSPDQPRRPFWLREFFGNPFRPVAVDPSWLTTDVRLLAQGIYEERAFGRLPILADALMDAGCADDDLLGHLRSEGPHVKGCWALDLVLGKQ